MGIRVTLNHTTTYRYDRPVVLMPHTVRLRPAPHAPTPILSYSLTVEPSPNFPNRQQDPPRNHPALRCCGQGPSTNRLARVGFQKPAQGITVAVDLVADLTTINPFGFFLEN